MHRAGVSPSLSNAGLQHSAGKPRMITLKPVWENPILEINTSYCVYNHHNRAYILLPSYSKGEDPPLN